jgi:hypothetical protein
MNETRAPDRFDPTTRSLDSQPPRAFRAKCAQAVSKRLAARFFVVGERLARWKLAFTEYPLDRDH